MVRVTLLAQYERLPQSKNKKHVYSNVNDKIESKTSADYRVETRQSSDGGKKLGAKSHWPWTVCDVFYTCSSAVDDSVALLMISDTQLFILTQAYNHTHETQKQKTARVLPLTPFGVILSYQRQLANVRLRSNLDVV